MSRGLTESELDELKRAIRAYMTLPFSTDVVGDQFEAIFAAATGGKVATPEGMRRSKLLFDVTREGIGWSLKTYSPPALPTAGHTFEIVIARASVFSGGLSIESGDPNDFGAAIMTIRRDLLERSLSLQGVDDPREGFLLRSKDNKSYMYFEEALMVEADDEIQWQWTDERRRGLQGRVGNAVKYRWYPSGSQLFARHTVPSENHSFEIMWSKIELVDLIELLTSKGFGA